MRPWRSAREEDHGESTVMRLAARVPSGVRRLFSGCGSTIVQDCARWRSQNYRWKNVADGRVASALLNFRVMNRNVDGCGGEPNRPGF